MAKVLDIARWASKQGRSLDDSVIAIKIELFSGIISDTRWKTGRLRGNWQTSTGEPILGEIDRLDPSGSLSTSQVDATVTANGVDYLTNNLPYAALWNERDGMVDRNVARLNQIISGAVE